MQIERAAAREHLGGARAVDLQGHLALADVDQRVRQAAQACAQRGERTIPIRLLHEQQLFVRPQPERCARIALGCATGLERQAQAESIPGQRQHLRTATQAHAAKPTEFTDRGGAGQGGDVRH